MPSAHANTLPMTDYAQEYLRRLDLLTAIAEDMRLPEDVGDSIANDVIYSTLRLPESILDVDTFIEAAFRNAAKEYQP